MNIWNITVEIRVIIPILYWNSKGGLSVPRLINLCTFSAELFSFIFIGTGLMGYAWAWAFSKTKSIMLPFGLHLGWNFIYNTIFSNGPLGELVFITKGGNELTNWMSLLSFTSGLVIVPILVLLFVRYCVKDETKLISESEKKYT